MNKKNIKKSAFVFLLLSGLFFAQFLFAANFGTTEVNTGLGGSLASGTDPRTIIARVINIALGFLGVIAVGIILYAGFKWMTANGDEDKITDAKKILRDGVIGLVIVLSSWAIATFILSKLSDATSGTNSGNGCNVEGATESCGCGGSMVCSGGSWQSCVGSSLNNCLTPPKSCDSNTTLAGCQAVNQICAAGYFCDTNCSCQLQGDSGASCDSDTTNAKCDADNNRCSEYTTCDPVSCLCVGSPVITGISPVGGFCSNNINQSCSTNDDCGNGNTCDTTTPNGTANNFLTISGKNFGAYATGTSQVIFLGSNSSKAGVLPTVINSSCVNFWSDTQIIIAVPSGVQTGPIQVINKDNFNDKTNDDYGPKINDFISNNISRPGLCSLDPTVGALSSQVNYQGINLHSGTAYFGNYKSNVSALYSTFSDASGLTGTSTIPNITAGDSGSFVETQVAGAVQKSNALKFTKAADANSGPYIKSFTPVETLADGQKVSRGPVGQYITINGAGFGGARGDNHVYFVSGSNKIEASYSFPAICVNSVWNDHQIIVKVPEMAEDYYQIQITLGDVTISTQNLNPNVFELNKSLALAPSLCKMDPEQGPVDTPVTFWGEYFGKAKDTGLVKFYFDKNANGTVGEEKDGSNTIGANVPDGATTGGVKVVKDSTSGNELNFTVGECTTDDECSGKICCPQNTYKKGRCVSTINECFTDIPTSVFEWGFSTSIATNTSLTFDSCLGLSKYLGSCYQGASCPNSPGACSSPSTSYQKTVGTCNISCKDAPGCNELTCTYNSEIDKCVQNKAAGKGVCDFPAQVNITKEVNADTKNDIPRIMYWSGKVNQHWDLDAGAWKTDPDGKSGSEIDQVTYCKKFYPTTVSVEPYKNETINTWHAKYNAGNYTNTIMSYRCVLSTDIYNVEKTCNSSGQWEISLDSSCPSGWTKVGNNKCIQNNVSCNICDANLSCQEVNSEGRCVSAKLCSDKDAKCVANSVASEADKCVINAAPTCECCCRIGYDKQDCCAGLTCAGKCGSDIINNSNTYGSCSGCANSGSTTEEHDAACNCSGHDSQYCSISTDHPEGICADCSGLGDQASCGDHSSACCFDSNKTATTTDDYCRGVSGLSVISKDKNSSNYGYCAYYGCYSASTTSSGYPEIPLGDPYACASTTPVKIGYFNKLDTCVSGCPNGVGNDVCHAFDNDQGGCSGETKCCYDKATSKCVTGNQIGDGANKGYCAYYACQTPPGNPLLCDSTPTTTSIFANSSICTSECANPPKGDGLDCSGTASSTCNFSLCDKSGFACLQDTKDSAVAVGGTDSSCGTCCCQVGLDKNGTTKDSCYSAATPTLHCKANQGACSGASRGLCCGCSNDNDCGAVSTTGCGSDTCCEARPSVIDTSPTASETNVCRNAAIKVTFNQKMDINSFNDNFLLYEELNYGDGTCPSGTFIADNRTVEDLINPQTKNVFVRLWESISLGIKRLFGNTNNQALAEAPTSSKLYCRVPGTVSSEQNGSQTDLIFNPTNILSPAAKFYAVIKGDENLNSQTGVLSSAEVGMNGQGFNDGGTFITSDQIKFNKLTYLNSYSFQFITLSSQGPNAGICAIDNINVSPSSYLFKTTTNDINENDSDISASTFDTVYDSDKLFTADAYSSDKQLLSPVKGYSWDWTWSVDNSNTIGISNSVVGMTENKSFVSAKSGVTDSEAKLKATINMDKYRTTGGCSDNCNKIFVGDTYFNTSDVYVFVCENPWPALKSDGTWSPWNDVGGNCSTGPGTCEGYNYKFYYCRDAGAAGTLDDLPAISSSPVTRGMSLLCSSDKTACTTSGAVCGANNDGVCLSSLLKESYFFRETVLAGGNIISATDTQKGGEVKLNWQSPISNIYSYKIYYLRSGRGSMMTKEIKPAEACSAAGSVYNCNAVISGLTNDQLYIFKLTVVSTNKTESDLSSEKTATPTDKFPPAIPLGLNVTVSDSQATFSWQANSDDTASYRLYHGIISGKYAESFDSVGTENSISVPLSKFSNDFQYFAVSAIDGSNNESGKTEKGYYFGVDNNAVTVWRMAADNSETPTNSQCLVKMNISAASSTVPVCSDNMNFTNPGFFVGTIKPSGGYPYCAVANCMNQVNPNKCRYLNGSWSKNCYIPN